MNQPAPRWSNETRAEFYALGADVSFGSMMVSGFLLTEAPWLAVFLLVSPGLGAVLKIKSIRLKSDLTPAQQRLFIRLYIGMAVLFYAVIGGLLLLRAGGVSS
jgi:hypothetical protein